MNSPQIPVSWGELLDKITILQIKLEQLTSEDALRNVECEITQLQSIFIEHCPDRIKVEQFKAELKKINQKLWYVEDRIREKERRKSFDYEFIQLARSVYFTNDERSRIKRNINEVFGSELIEEKSYSDYKD